MKISLEWLKQYVDYNDSVERLADIFTEAGFPVEEIRQVGSDVMLDVEITSNRSDCLGHVGLAREVAAVTGCAFSLPVVEYAEGAKAVGDWTSVVDEAAELCNRYTARVIDGVTIGPSPEWMVKRLATVGVRSINNVVDITNYVMMEVGQPLHSFDYARLGEGRIVVRRAALGEQMEMIDHSKIELNPEMLVIADANRPVALAGVMGGLDSEVSGYTQTILLESAHFAPLSVRSTARSLSMGSEASYRFERDVDVEMCDWASRRATGLLVELAGGQAAGGVVDVWPVKRDGCEIRMRMSRLKALLGVEVDKEYIMGVFERLGFRPDAEGDCVVCQQPSWRRDVYREVDLIEEVIRVKGYGCIPTEKRIHIEVATRDKVQRTRDNITGTLSGCGYYETVNVGFLEDKHLELFSEAGYEPVRVKDFTRKSNNALRHTLLASLLAVRQRNQAAGNGRCDMYELAATHRPGGEAGALPAETIMLSLMTDGDFRELRGVIENVAAGLDQQAKVGCRAAEVFWAGTGKGAEVLVDDKVVGVMGQLDEKIRDAFGLVNDVCLAEIRFEELTALEGRVPQLQGLLHFPPVNRDLSLVLADEVAWEKIEGVIWAQQLADMRKLEFVDIYRGKGVAAGKKSLTLTMEFRRAEETLTHEKVDEYQGQILDALKKEFGAELRA